MDEERAVRFVDVGVEEAEVTFDMGGPADMDEVRRIMEVIENLEE